MYDVAKDDGDSPWWFFAPRPGGAWLLTTFVPDDRGKRISKVTFGPRSDGWSLLPGVGGETSVFLERPTHQGDPWHLAFGEGKVQQRLDPDTASLAARLSEGLRFVRLDERHPPGSGRVEDAYTKDAIDVQDGLFTRLEIFQHDEVHCDFDVLVPLPFHERSPRRAPPPAVLSPEIHAVQYALLKTRLPCPDVFEPDGPYESTELGGDAGVTLFVRRGEPLGAVVVSYMYAGLFVAPNVKWEDVAAMTKVAKAALEEQAE